MASPIPAVLGGGDLQERVQLAAHITSFGVYHLDRDGIIRSWNPGARQLTGFADDAVIGRPYRDLLEETREGPGKAHQALDFCRGNLRLREEQWRRRADGGAFLADVSMELARDAEGRIMAFVEVFEDITEAKEREEALYRQATRDALTGVANRGHFSAVAETEIERALRFSEPLSVALLDIDHFKQVNDTYGHEAGDDALKAFAEAVSERIRRLDTLGRIGGEEFALLLPRASASAAFEMLQEVRHRVAAISVPCGGGRELSFTVSMGLTQLRPGAHTLADLLRQADAALYRAKHEGRNQVQVWRDYSEAIKPRR